MLGETAPAIGTPEFGNAFEQLAPMELKAYQAYRNPELEIRYWRAASGLEVDFILGDMEVALEIKGKRRIHKSDVSPMKALLQEHRVKKALIVSLEDEPRTLESSITVVPWRKFLDMLWDGELL